jgi:hypothetical protein
MPVAGRTLVALLAISGWGDATSWMEQYAAESAAAGQTCEAKDYAACRQHLMVLLELLNGRADIVYRLTGGSGCR